MCGALRFSVFTFCFCPPREKHSGRTYCQNGFNNTPPESSRCKDMTFYVLQTLNFLLCTANGWLIFGWWTFGWEGEWGCSSLNLPGLMVSFGDKFLVCGGDAKGIQSNFLFGYKYWDASKCCIATNGESSLHEKKVLGAFWPHANRFCIVVFEKFPR